MNTDAHLARLKALNHTAAFNRWCGLEVVSVDEGRATIAMPWRDEFGQYAGFAHAGIVGGFIDTACGYAATTVAGPVLASHYAINCVRPAVGRRFIARARVVKAGKSQVFTTCEMFGETDKGEVLVATGEVLLVPVAGSAA